VDCRFYVAVSLQPYLMVPRSGSTQASAHVIEVCIGVNDKERKNSRDSNKHYALIKVKT
jgi:hypothetical protein